MSVKNIKNLKLFSIMLILALFVIVCIVTFSNAYKYVPEEYKPTQSLSFIKNVTLSGCSPPETVNGCSKCNDGLEYDCLYYFGSRVSDCSVVFPADQKDYCFTWMYWNKVREPSTIPSVCKLMSTDAAQYSCIMSLVSNDGESVKQCNEISTSTDIFKNYRQSCILDYSVNFNKPDDCAGLDSVDVKLDCCGRAKGVKEQYVASRVDLIESYKKKNQKEFDDCKLLLKIKDPIIIPSCEDLNCDCLSPCNKLKDDVDKQRKCAGDCGKKYIECYDEANTEMPFGDGTAPGPKDMYFSQSFYGMFSRKHCSEYKGSLSAKLKKDDHEEKQEPVECTSHNDCNKGRLCDACGQCRDEKDLSPAEDVKLTYKIDPEDTEISIRNTIDKTAVFRVNFEPQFLDTKKDKDIKYCDMLYPGIKKDVKLVATMNGPEELHFAGFTTGSLLDPRDVSAKCTVDLKEERKRCSFIVSPNDRKKPVGLVDEVVNYIDLSVIEDNKAYGSNEQIAGVGEAVLRLVLKPSGPKINFRMGTSQMQQGTTRAIKFDIIDPDTKIVMVNAKVIGPATLFMPEDGSKIDLKSLHFTTEPIDDVQIGIKAPEMGNFDIGKEINSLSMTDLQTEAGKQILTDAAWAGVDVGLDKVSGSVKAVSDQEKNALEAYKKYIKANPDYRSAQKTANFVMDAKKGAKYEEDVAKLINLYKFNKGVINDLPGIHGGIKTSQDDVGVNVKQADQEGPSVATGTEKAANVGVTAINIAQLGVGVLTFVPNKIPGVGQLTAGFQVAFSAATNIWKANLKYIAQAEKIDRAAEVFVPVMVVVTAEDMSGWQAQSAYVMKIAYHQV